MNLRLERTRTTPEGVFGRLSTEDGRLIAYTLEHAFGPFPEAGYFAKVPKGIYRCVRGTHKLHDGIPFETFEVLKVPGATGILFHVGNYNKDSEGCILLGEAEQEDSITHSRAAFEKFMQLQAQTNEFFLEVV